MFDYEDLTEEQMDKLEDSDEGGRITAIMMLVQGIRKNILTKEDGLKQINNIAFSLLT